MKTIEVDDEIYAFLEKNARPLTDTATSVLRRFLPIDGSLSAPPRNIDPLSRDSSSLSKAEPPRVSSYSRKAKAAKAHLGILVQSGRLKSGQSVYLIDYKGNKIPGIVASIEGRELSFKGVRYSMSDLAQQQLRACGYEAPAVRGPSHWVTDSNRSITELWQEHLSGAGK